MNLGSFAALILGIVIPGSAQSLDSAAQTPAVAPRTPSAPRVSSAAGPLTDQRILGVIPDFQTVRDTTHYVPPLTPREKWLLAEKGTFDPFNIVSAAMTAGFSQMGNQTPKYGEGWPDYGKRFAAGFADGATQNFFSAGILANLLHQDPRYFRRGTQSKFFPRIFYSATRLFVAQQDSGKAAFNLSNIGGMLMGIGASNLYYPRPSVRGSVMLGRINTSLFGGVVGNLMSEFWPDVQDKFFRKKK